MITLIWAEDKNGLIGKQGKLPWHLPNDLAFFKKMTQHHTIVMGRKTFEGMGKRLLPNRQTIILTTNSEYDGNGARVETEFKRIVDMAKDNDIYIVGGSKVYELFAPYADCLIQTKIDFAFDGDAYITQMPFEQFKLVSQEHGVIDDNNHYAHTFNIYNKK